MQIYFDFLYFLFKKILLQNTTGFNFILELDLENQLFRNHLIVLQLCFDNQCLIALCNAVD